MLPLTLLACLLPAAALVSAQNSPYGHSYMQPANGSDLVNVRIGLVSQDTPALEALVRDISTPGSSRYAKYASRNDLKSFVQPSNTTLTTVTSWLGTFNITTFEQSFLGNVLSFNLTVEKANELVTGNYSTYVHDYTGQTYMRTTNFTIPDNVKAVTTFIYPLDQFDMMQTSAFAFVPTKRQSDDGGANGGSPKNTTKLPDFTNATAESCAKVITPACLQKLYEIPNSRTNSTNKTSLSVVGYIDQFPQANDLRAFLNLTRPDLFAANETFNVTLVSGGEATQGAGFAGSEANLDIQYTVGLVNGLDVDFVSVGGRAAVQTSLDTIESLLLTSDPVTTLSISYGGDEIAAGNAEAKAICNGFMALTALGISTLISSGDSGVAGNRDISCNKTGEPFVPVFPASCPFITSVGATVFNGSAENAVSANSKAQGNFFSGGGFSDVFERPDYQKQDVTDYILKVHDNPDITGRFNVSGRAYPDISAMGANAVLVNDSSVTTIGGTSLSAPIIASMIALVNDELVSAGLQPLGFLNPFLYKNKAIFNDVTVGNNAGCGSNGFPATAGWDPLTGLGTPQYSKLLQAAFAAQNGTSPSSGTNSSISGLIQTSNKPASNLTTDQVVHRPYIGPFSLAGFVGVIIAGVAALIILILAGCYCCRRRRSKPAYNHAGPYTNYGPPQVNGAYRPLNDPAPEAAEVYPYRP